MRSSDGSSSQIPETQGSDAATTTKASVKPGGERDMGAALRKVYQHTIEESIPPEMLDLLGRLD